MSMATPLLGVAALAASFTGFCALALAMERHEAACLDRPLRSRQRTALRLAGSTALASALAASLRMAGPAQGWVLWFGALTAAALAVVLLQSYAPRRTVALGGACAALALLCVAIGRH